MKRPRKKRPDIAAGMRRQFVLISEDDAGFIIECQARKLSVREPLPEDALIPHKSGRWVPAGQHPRWIVRHVFSGDAHKLLTLMFELNRYAGGEDGGWSSAFGEGLDAIVEAVYAAGQDHRLHILTPSQRARRSA